jgi:hypothetical protein
MGCVVLPGIANVLLPFAAQVRALFTNANGEPLPNVFGKVSALFFFAVFIHFSFLLAFSNNLTCDQPLVRKVLGVNDERRAMLQLDTNSESPFASALRHVRDALKAVFVFEDDFKAAALHALSGTREQAFHTDFSVSLLPTAPPLPHMFGCIIALDPETTLGVRGYHDKNRVISIPIGAVCAFPRWTIHQGTGYTSPNTRIYMAFRSFEGSFPVNEVFYP